MYACPMDPSDNMTFTRLPQSPAGRLHTSLIELNPACYDVIFSPLDNSLFYGKHPLSDGSIGCIGQSDFHEVGAHASDMLEFYFLPHRYLDTFTKIIV